MGCCCSKLEAIIEDRFEGQEIIAKELWRPSYEYRKIRPSAVHTRGNGALVLTRRVLWFHFLCMDSEVEITLSSITNVTVSKVFSKPGLYKAVWPTGPQGFLGIEFTDPSTGDRDEIVFNVSDANAWKNYIQVAKMSRPGWEEEEGEANQTLVERE